MSEKKKLIEEEIREDERKKIRLEIRAAETMERYRKSKTRRGY